MVKWLNGSSKFSTNNSEAKPYNNKTITLFNFRIILIKRKI